ncbi:hypothetical protein [Lentzea flava]|uniref:Transposase n=1 Tax=Lentzea flava TaxID=103732 RepID=A0ABQ2V8A8_9PSEU|nr:hypothetical protein [Lentzea flava]GGU73977.1 hypothetical protein GCM10010178_76790 [Lentzea flava]
MPPRKRRSYTAEYKVEAAHREGQRVPGKSLGVLCRDAEEPARFALIAKYAGPDDVAGVTGIAAPEGDRFAVRRMARLLSVSASGYYPHVKRCAATKLTPRQQRRADL